MQIDTQNLDLSVAFAAYLMSGLLDDIQSFRHTSIENRHLIERILKSMVPLNSKKSADFVRILNEAAADPLGDAAVSLYRSRGSLRVAVNTHPDQTGTATGEPPPWPKG